MAFPTTITTGGDVTVGDSRPYVSSGDNVYVIVRDDVTTSKLRAFKASAPDTSFSNVGTDPQVTSTLAIQSYATYQVGDVIHVVTLDYSSIGTVDLRYHKFDMSSDSWTLTNETIKNDMALVSTTNQTSLGIVVRSSGDVIVLYNGPKVANMGTDRDRVYYARRVSGVWTVDVVVDNAGATSWFAYAAVLGSSDRTHFHFTDGSASDGYQRTLTSGNSLETFPSSYDTAMIGDAAHPGGGVSYDKSGTQKIVFPYVDSPSTQQSAIRFNSADAPTVSATADITGATNTDGGHFETYMVNNGTTVYHFFIDSSLDIYYTTSTDDGATWAAPTSFYTGSATKLYASIFTRGGAVVAGIVFSETDPKYTELTITAASNKFSMVPAASVTWSGASIARGNMNPIPAALVTWNGASTATTVFNSAAVASVTWNGNGIYPAAWAPTALASVTWNSKSTASADLTAAAAASVTWNGTSTATAALSAVPAALVTWNGTSTATGAWSAAAVATVTWNGTAIQSAAWAPAAAATVTWGGAAIAGGSITSGAFSMAAAASVTWNGASRASTDFSSLAAAVVAWNSAAIDAGDWSAAAAASVTWTGQAVSQSGAAFNFIAAASATFAGTSTSSAALSAAAAASAVFVGSTAEGVTPRFDGWRREEQRKREEEIEEEDIMLLAAAAFAYLGQHHVHH